MTKTDKIAPRCPLSVLGLLVLFVASCAVVSPQEIMSIHPNWDGKLMTLQERQSVNMPQTPSGSMIFAYQNTATQNNAGTLKLGTGGNEPKTYSAPALTGSPITVTHNWQGNNLFVTNYSSVSETPIEIQAFGPGMHGTDSPEPLDVGKPLELPPSSTAEGPTLARRMLMVFRVGSDELGVFGLIGGPLQRGINGYVFTVNDIKHGNTGPGTGHKPPKGYTATRKSRRYAYPFDWNGGRAFVVNLSPDSTTKAKVILRRDPSDTISD